MSGTVKRPVIRKKPGAPAQGYEPLFERLVDDAGFLWLLRDKASRQANYNRREQQALDDRLETFLQALDSSPETAWPPAFEAAQMGSTGESFVAAHVAFTGVAATDKAPGWIEAVLELARADARRLQGLVSLLGWRPALQIRPWIWSWLHSDEPALQHLALCACSVRREDPGQQLTELLCNPRSLTHAQLHARALRLLGELKRFDLLHHAQAARGADDPEIRFWSLWSGVLLGEGAALPAMQSWVLQPGPWQSAAIDLAFRAVPLEMGRAWISQMAQDANQRLQVIQAAGVLGDAQALPWLVQQMREPALARSAGEAFARMTGIDLVGAGLARIEGASMEDDEADSPLPDVVALESLLPQVLARMPRGTRYLLGKTVEERHLQEIHMSGSQQQRRIAALELALKRPEQILPNIAMREAADG